MYIYVYIHLSYSLPKSRWIFCFLVDGFINHYAACATGAPCLRSLQIPWRDVAQEAVSSLATQLTRRKTKGRGFEGLTRFYFFFKYIFSTEFAIVGLCCLIFLIGWQLHGTLTWGVWKMRCLDSELQRFNPWISLNFHLSLVTAWWVYCSCFGEFPSWVTCWDSDGPKLMSMNHIS